MVEDRMTWGGSFRAVRLGNVLIEGPTRDVRTVELYPSAADWPMRPRQIHDPDLVDQFDAGMDLGPWLDWAAERHLDLMWAADAYVAAGRTAGRAE